MEHICDNTSCTQDAKHICAGCFQMAYCGADCQKTHWNSEHEYQCDNAPPPSYLSISKKYVNTPMAKLDRGVEALFEKFWRLENEATDDFKKLTSGSKSISRAQAASTMKLVKPVVDAYDAARDKFFEVYGLDTKNVPMVRIFLRAKLAMLQLVGDFLKQRMDENWAAFERTNNPAFKKQAEGHYQKAQMNLNNRTVWRYEDKYNEKIGGVPKNKAELMAFMKSRGFQKFGL